MFLYFFFQAEDGIRDLYVTGVQTCALPISAACSSAPRMVVTSIVLVGAGAGSSDELQPATPPAARTSALAAVRRALPVTNIGLSSQTGDRSLAGSGVVDVR